MRQRGAILGRCVARPRGFVAGKLDNHIAVPSGAFRRLERAATHEEPAAEPGESDAVGSNIFLVGLGVGDIDPADPVALGYPKPPF